MLYYQESYKGYSPWGGIEDSKVIAKGLKIVSTATHGGYMVTENFANKYLSEKSKKYAIKYKNYLCYEEDCDFTILCYELIDTFGDRLKGKNSTIEEYKEKLIKIINKYYPEYLAN